jgi:proteasome accessory factor B
MQSVERLLNLVTLLLDSETPLSFSEIRNRLPAYSQDDIASAKRMFERDKDALRAQGVPIELVATDPWETEEGYTISRDAYALADIAFTEEELSALFVAAAAPGDDDDAAQALRKLASGAETSLAITGVAPMVVAGPEASGATLQAVTGAIQHHLSIRFSYRNAAGDVSDRHLDPYSLVIRAGNVYVVGLDRDRGQIRSFRLSRVASDVAEGDASSLPPDGFRARDHIAAGPWAGGAGEQVHVRIAFSPEVAWIAAGQMPKARPAATRPDGWVELEADVPSPISDRLASWVLSFADEAEVLAPQELRDAVVARLEAVLASL